MHFKKLTLFIIWLLIIQAVSASVISLTTTVTTNIMTDKTAKTHVKLLNSGDESAYKVQISLLTDSFKTDQLYVGNLDPNMPFEGDLNVTRTKEILPGDYPLVILTDYADANSYPFSSVSQNYITYKTHTVSRVSGVIPQLTLNGKESKKLVLTVRNLDDVQHDVKIKLFVPRELKIDNDKLNLTLKSKEEKTFNFDVSSFSALSGSSYVVVASLEYENENMHYSSFAQSIINIKEAKPLSIPFWIPIVTFIVLLIIFFYYLKRGKK